MTTSIMTKTVSPDLIITTPTQLLAAYAKMLQLIGMREPEVTQVAVLNTNLLIEMLKELNKGS